MTAIREFTCIKCGHRVVVRPELPADHEPTVCTPCWDADKPIRDAKTAKIMAGVANLLSLMGMKP